MYFLNVTAVNNEGNLYVLTHSGNSKILQRPNRRRRINVGVTEADVSAVTGCRE